MAAGIPHDEPTPHDKYFAPHADCSVRPCPYCASINAALAAADEPDGDDTYLDPREDQP